MSAVTLASLAESRRWVAWTLARRDGTGKPTKTPFTAPGRMARSNDAFTWLTQAEAERVAARLDRLDDMGGVGLMLGAHDGLGLGGIDLDDCRDPETGSITPWAAEVIGRFASYAEVSPSGTGVKVFVSFDPSQEAAIRQTLGGQMGRKFAAPGGGEHGAAIEIYSGGRFFAVTGERLPDSPAELRPVRLADLEWVTHEAGPALAKKPAASGSAASALMPAASGTAPTDNSRSGRAFRVAMRLAAQIAAKGGTVDDLDFALETGDDEELVDWLYAKGRANGGRELQRAWDRAVARVRPTSAGDDFAALTPAPDRPAGGARGLRLLSLHDCDAAPDRGYVLKHMLAPGDLGALIGSPGGGKSVVGPYIAYRIAQGQLAFGCRTKPGPVLYVAAEDAIGMRGRLAALRRVYGDAPNLHLVEGLSDLHSPDSPDRAELARIVAEVRPVLIVLDTLAMAFPGLEENSAEAMGRVVAVGRGLARGGAAVMLVHHTTKAGDGTPRGHSILNGALDVVIELDRAGEDGVIRGYLRKNRNGPCDRAIAFKIGTVEHGTDADGDAIIRPYCVEIGGDAAASKRADRLTPNTKAHLRVLQGLEPTDVAPNGLPAVRVDLWRDRCHMKRVCSSDEQRVRNTAFRRAYADLAERGLIEAHASVVWLKAAKERAEDAFNVIPDAAEPVPVNFNGDDRRASKASQGIIDASDAHGGVADGGHQRHHGALAHDALMPPSTAGGEVVKNKSNPKAGLKYKRLPPEALDAIRDTHGGDLAERLSGLLLDKDAMVVIEGMGDGAAYKIAGSHIWRAAGGEARA